MREHRPRRRRVQTGVDRGVEDRHDLADGARALGELGQDLPLPLQPVGAIGADEGLHLPHRRAVGGPEGLGVQRLHLVEAGVIGAHVPVRRADDRGGPAHDVIAAEQGVLFGEQIADVVRGVAGGGDGRHRPVRAGDDLAVRNLHVRFEVRLAVLFRRTRFGVSPAEDHGPGPRCEGAGEGGVVDMRVGDQDRRDALARDGGKDRLQMRRIIRARIDYSDFSGADDVGAGAEEGEGAGIVRHHPADQRGDLIDPTVLKGHVLDEGDHARASERRRAVAQRLRDPVRSPRKPRVHGTSHRPFRFKAAPARAGGDAVSHGGARGGGGDEAQGDRACDRPRRPIRPSADRDQPKRPVM